MTFNYARFQMAEWLEQNAITSPDHPGSGYDEMNGALPRGVDVRWDKLFIVLSFWDGWIDANNHEWQYYEPIQENDWPRLAR